MVEASSHCWDSRCPSVNQRGYLLGTMEMPWCGWPTSPEPPEDSSTWSLAGAHGNVKTKVMFKNTVKNLTALGFIHMLTNGFPGL